MRQFVLKMNDEAQRKNAQAVTQNGCEMVTAGVLLLDRKTKLSRQKSCFASGTALKTDRRLYKSVITMVAQRWYLYYRVDC